MRKFENHIISQSAALKEGLIAINNLRDELLCLFVTDDEGCLKGTLTDGDIRRALIKGVALVDPVSYAMNPHFECIRNKNVLPAEIKRLRRKGIKLLPYLNFEGKIDKVYNLKERKSILPIDAVLMAGGKGIRLKPLTDNTPKPLLKIGDKCIIDFNIERLIKYGIENINVTVNYLAEQIEDHFSKEISGVRINCVREPEYCGTIGSVKFISNFFHDNLLIMNSDLFTNIDFEEFYEMFINEKADMAVAAIPYSVAIPYGIFNLVDENIKGLDEKPTYTYYANGGIYLIKKSILDQIPDNTFFDATDLIGMLIEKGFKVVKFPLIGYWVDIGKHEDFKKVQEFARHINL